MRIGVLGSAFDPPHKAHIEVAKRAKRVLNLDRIILIPTNIPPHKAMPAVPSRLRLHMARLAAKGRRGWIVSDMELSRRGISYTRDTIRALKRKYPRDEIFWIIGSDGLVSMPWKWKGGYTILDLCQFVVARRRGFSLSRVSPRILKRVIILPGMPTHMASTRVRELIAAGKKSVRKFLDPKVLQFIVKQQLYKVRWKMAQKKIHSDF